MAAEARYQTHTLTSLSDDAPAYDFFQLVRLLERKLGGRESIRFANQTSLAFPASAVQAIEVDESVADALKVRLYLSFIGLSGQSGVLPLHVSELMLSRINLKDYSLQDFFNLFNHQIADLFYRAWKRSHFFVNYEQSEEAIKTDHVLSFLRAVMGRPRALNESRRMAEASLYYSGLLQPQVKTPEGLCRMLSDYFGLPFDINQFCGEWLDLPVKERSRLASAQDQTAHNQLGAGITLGKRCWYAQNRFEILIGPISYDTFQHLLPDGEWMGILRELILQYIGFENQYLVTLLLKSETADCCQLNSESPARLGWTGYLKPKVKEERLIAVRLAEQLSDVYRRSHPTAKLEIA